MAKDAPTDAGDTVVPERLRNKTLPNEKLFCLFAAFEQQGAFTATTWKLAAAFSDGHFTPAALEFNLRDWRQETRKVAQEKGMEVAQKAEKMPKTSGLGKGHNSKKRANKEVEGEAAGEGQTSEPSTKKNKLSGGRKGKKDARMSEATVKEEPESDDAGNA